MAAEMYSHLKPETLERGHMRPYTGIEIVFLQPELDDINFTAKAGDIDDLDSTATLSFDAKAQVKKPDIWRGWSASFMLNSLGRTVPDDPKGASLGEGWVDLEAEEVVIRLTLWPQSVRDLCWLWTVERNAERLQLSAHINAAWLDNFDGPEVWFSIVHFYTTGLALSDRY